MEVKKIRPLEIPTDFVPYSTWKRYIMLFSLISNHPCCKETLAKLLFLWWSTHYTELSLFRKICKFQGCLDLQQLQFFYMVMMRFPLFLDWKWTNYIFYIFKVCRILNLSLVITMIYALMYDFALLWLVESVSNMQSSVWSVSLCLCQLFCLSFCLF